MNDKTRKAVKILAIMIYIVIFLIIGVGLAERAIVKYSAESVLEQIRIGFDDETMNKVVDNLISQVVGDGYIGAKLQKSINGDDINDIYYALLNGMDYKVYAVEKAGYGNYRVGMLIRNRDNIKVGREAWEVFKSRYDVGFLGNIEQGVKDFSSDWSQLFAMMFIEASQNLESEIGSALFTSQSYVIDISVDGDLHFENQDGEISFLLLCAGIPIGSAPSDEITDEYKIYLIIFLILIAVPVVLFLYHRSKNPDDNVGVNSNKSIEDKNPAEKAAGKRIAILYAKTPQHNNMPFAVHSTPIFIGRDPASCKILFGEGAVGVSRKHCCIRYDASAEAFVLTDLRSTYGTYLNNGRKLEPDKLYNLKPGDSFYAGDKANMFSVELN